MTGKEREKLGTELAGILRRIARERDELAELAKERKRRIEKLENRADELCDLIEGRAGVQLPVPGTQDEQDPPFGTHPPPPDRRLPPEKDEEDQEPKPRKRKGRGRGAVTIRCPFCRLLHRTGDGIDPKCWQAMSEDQRRLLEGAEP